MQPTNKVIVELLEEELNELTHKIHFLRKDFNKNETSIQDFKSEESFLLGLYYAVSRAIEHLKSR